MVDFNKLKTPQDEEGSALFVSTPFIAFFLIVLILGGTGFLFYHYTYGNANIALDQATISLPYDWEEHVVKVEDNVYKPKSGDPKIQQHLEETIKSKMPLAHYTKDEGSKTSNEDSEIKVSDIKIKTRDNIKNSGKINKTVEVQNDKGKYEPKEGELKFNQSCTTSQMADIEFTVTIKAPYFTQAIGATGLQRGSGKGVFPDYKKTVKKPLIIDYSTEIWSDWSVS